VSDLNDWSRLPELEFDKRRGSINGESGSLVSYCSLLFLSFFTVQDLLCLNWNKCLKWSNKLRQNCLNCGYWYISDKWERFTGWGIGVNMDMYLWPLMCIPLCTKAHGLFSDYHWKCTWKGAVEDLHHLIRIT
jgi:hypothetical protein